MSPRALKLNLNWILRPPQTVRGYLPPDTSPEVDARPLKVVEGRDIIDGDTNNSAVVSPENLNNKKCPHLE